MKPLRPGRRHASRQYLDRPARGRQYHVYWSFVTADAGRVAWRESRFVTTSPRRAAGLCLYTMHDFARAQCGSVSVCEPLYDSFGYYLGAGKPLLQLFSKP